MYYPNGMEAWESPVLSIIPYRILDLNQGPPGPQSKVVAIILPLQTNVNNWALVYLQKKMINILLQGFEKLCGILSLSNKIKKNRNDTSQELTQPPVDRSPSGSCLSMVCLSMVIVANLLVTGCPSWHQSTSSGNVTCFIQKLIYSACNKY